MHARTHHLTFKDGINPSQSSELKFSALVTKKSQTNAKQNKKTKIQPYHLLHRHCQQGTHFEKKTIVRYIQHIFNSYYSYLPDMIFDTAKL